MQHKMYTHSIIFNSAMYNQQLVVMLLIYNLYYYMVGIGIYKIYVMGNSHEMIHR